MYLTDKQWELIKDYFRSNNRRGNPKHSKRLLVDAVIYMATTGCQWRRIPSEFPPWRASPNEGRA